MDDCDNLFVWIVFFTIVTTGDATISSWVMPTVGGNGGGAPCVFPFIYDGYSWDSCIEAGISEQFSPWCGTTNDFDTDGSWGYCLQTVRVYEAPDGYTHCTFPYLYGGTWYYGCQRPEPGPATYDSQPWCGVVADVDSNPGMVGKCIMQYKAYSDALAFSSYDESPNQHLYGQCDGPQRGENQTVLPRFLNNYGCFQSPDGAFTSWCYTDHNMDPDGVPGTCDNIARYSRVYSPGELIVAGKDFATWHLTDGWASPISSAPTTACTTDIVNPWFAIELPYMYRVQEVQLMNIQNQNIYPYMYQNQKNFDIKVGNYLNTVALSDSLSLMQLCGSQGSTSLNKGAMGTWTQAWSCPANTIGHFVLLYGVHVTHVTSMCFAEMNVFGDFVGEIAGMPQPRRDDSVVHTNPTLPSGPKTFLFPGVDSKIIDDGVLVAWSVYAKTTDPIELQIWRPTNNVREYTMKYSKTVSGSSGNVRLIDVESDGFDVRGNDVIGISFAGTSPTPVSTVACAYNDFDGGAFSQDSALSLSSFHNTIDVTTVVFNLDNCKDYLVTAAIRYYACRSSPCINGGTCAEVPAAQPRNSFICTCPPGYRGTFCQWDIDQCDEQNVVCQNGGTCVNEARLDWHCLCAPGWDGLYCQYAQTTANPTTTGEVTTTTTAAIPETTNVIQSITTEPTTVPTTIGYRVCDARGHMELVSRDVEVSDVGVSLTCREGVRRHMLCAGVCLYQSTHCNSIQYTSDTRRCCTFAAQNYTVSPVMGTDIYQLKCN